MTPKKPWYKQKTTWTTIAGMVTTFGGFLAGEVGFQILIGAVFAGLTIIFGRQGIENSKS